jgi:hypothetical protein
MDAALIGRIEVSVRGSRHARSKKVAPRTKRALLRVALVIVLVGIASAVLVARRRYREEVNATRASLLETLHAQHNALTPQERDVMARIEPWLQNLGASYEGDVVASEIRSVKALDALLARPSVYVRGPAGAFTTSAAIAEAAAASTRDSFLLCLLDPPATRGEKAVLSKVRTAYAGGGATSGQARRLREVVEGLHRLLLPWEDRLQHARELRDLDRIKGELSNVHAEETKRAAQAEILIVAMDEAGEGGAAELDGERPHHVRVAIVDLRSGTLLLRVRKRVDPNWLAASTRSNFASAVDGCALAFDIRGDIVR